MRNLIECDQSSDRIRKLKACSEAYHVLSMHKEAIYECRKLVRLAPNDADSFVRLGYQCDEGGQTSKAIRYYRFALKKFPDDAYIYTNLGFCYERYKKRPDLALVCYEKAIELEPSHVWALNNIGTIFQRENNRFAALRYYKKAWYAAKREGEVDYAIWHNLGSAYYRCKFYHRAWVILRHLLKEYPDNESVYCDFGMVNYRIGAYSRAWDLFSRALSIKPDSKYYRRLYSVARKKVVK